MVASWTETGTPHFASVCFIARNQCGRSVCIRQASTVVLGGRSPPAQELNRTRAAKKA